MKETKKIKGPKNKTQTKINHVCLPLDYQVSNQHLQ